MEDSELTRKAIEELMKEMDEYKEKESMPMERKKNPLGRPNKLFLGRTINSVMTHNKRQSDRNLQRCERKLKELDAKQRKHKFKKHRTDHLKLDSSHEVISSDSYDEAYTKKTSKQIKKKKKKRRKKKHESRSPSPSSTSSSTSTTDSGSSSINSSVQSKNRNRKKERHKTVKEEDYTDYNNESTMGYYVDPNMAYAIMAYSQMNHMMQQQELIQQQIIKKDIEESIEIPSDLSLSCPSSPESSLNITLHSSSAEEDENGILTFKLSSDDEEKSSHISQTVNKKSAEINNKKYPIIDCNENDKDSVHSHISLDSIDSQRSIIKEADEIYSLSSSCTDSEEIEIVETSGNVSSLFQDSKKNII